MEPIAPKVETFILPEDYELPVYAADQPQYEPLPAIRLRDGRVVTQWLLTQSEADRLRAGEPITLVLHTFNVRRCGNCGVLQPNPLQPITLGVGGYDLT